MGAEGSRRFVIIGAGAIGGAIGGVLARAEVPTVVVARGRNAEVLAAEGLRLLTPDGSFRVAVDTVCRPEELRLTVDDVLVFATKTQHLEEALRQWVDQPVHLRDSTTTMAGQALPAFMALNGVAAEPMASRYFARVFGICVWCPAVHVKSGEVIVRLWPTVAQLHIARWPAALTDGQDAELLESIATAWRRAGIDVHRPDDVSPWKYNKLLLNLANAVGALSGEVADGSPLCRGAFEEGVAVLRSARRDFVPFERSRKVRLSVPSPRPDPGGSKCRATPRHSR